MDLDYCVGNNGGYLVGMEKYVHHLQNFGCTKGDPGVQTLSRTSADETRGNYTTSCEECYIAVDDTTLYLNCQCLSQDSDRLVNSTLDLSEWPRVCKSNIEGRGY
jgi:hypothetical protein